MITRAFALAAFAVLLASPALAQTIDVRPTAVTVLEMALTALATVLTVVGGVGIRVATNWVGLSNSRLEQSLQERLDFIIHQGFEYAKTAAVNEIMKDGSGLDRVKVDNWLMKTVGDYVMKAAPGILARFKINEERLRELVLARVPAHFALPAPTSEPVSGGVAATPITKDANAELGKPGSRSASADLKPMPDAPVTVG